MNIIDNSQCSCGNALEDNIHFFFTCPLYIAPRRILHEKISLIAPFNMRIVLYGDENLSLPANSQIFEAVHEYIEESGRFAIN